MEQHMLPKQNGMAKASLILGVLAVLSVLSILFITYTPFFGCMGILFALLSRGSSYKMPEKALGGFIASLVALVLCILITIVSFYIVIRLFGLETVLDPAALNEAMAEYYNNLLNSLTTGGNAL